MTQICFDDGPCELTELALDLLAAARRTATFALVGEKALERPETVARIVREGHTVANHSMTHARLSDLAPADVEREVDECTAALRSIGAEPVALRPPFVASNAIVEEVAGRRGLTLLAQSSAGDYLYDDPDELAHACRSYTSFLGLHDTHKVTVAALPAILEHLPE